MTPGTGDRGLRHEVKDATERSELPSVAPPDCVFAA